MSSTTKRRVLGIAGVLIATQLLSACIVLPVPAHRQRPVVIHPGHGHYQAPPPAHHPRHPHWGR